MTICVEISMDDQGQLTVGIDDEPSSDLDDMQPADNIDQALAIAKHLLMNPPQDTDGDEDDGAGEGGGSDDEEAPDTANAGGAPGAAGGADAGAAAANAGGTPGAPGGAPGGAAQPSAKDIWDQLAAQQHVPPH